jgi:hypothetical protein
VTICREAPAETYEGIAVVGDGIADPVEGLNAVIADYQIGDASREKSDVVEVVTEDLGLGAQVFTTLVSPATTTLRARLRSVALMLLSCD